MTDVTHDIAPAMASLLQHPAGRDHAGSILADLRRRQLALALDGDIAASAEYAELASAVRSLLDELDELTDAGARNDDSEPVLLRRPA